MKASLFTFLVSLFAVSPALAQSQGESVSLSAALMKHEHLNEAQAAEQSEHVFSAIREELKSGRAVEIRNFGRFYLAERKKTAKPGAPETAAAPSRKFPRFTSAESLKEDVNAKKS